MTERPPQPDPDADDLQDPEEHEGEASPEDFEEDEARNPEDDRLRDIKGG
jgi:hypothetical protein